MHGAGKLLSCAGARMDGFCRRFGFGSCGTAVLPIATCVPSSPGRIYYFTWVITSSLAHGGVGGGGVGRKRHLLSSQDGRKICRLKAGW